MTQVGIYIEIKHQSLGVTLGFTLGNPLGLRIYFTVYPSSHHNSNTVTDGANRRKVQTGTSARCILLRLMQCHTTLTLLRIINNQSVSLTYFS